jgi:ATP-binding cassette, subfamily B, heavy metal transporter
MRHIVDSLNASIAVIAVPVATLVTYGLLRLSAILLVELRDVVFFKVSRRAMRNVALRVFRHLLGLSLQFHLNRQTGGLIRDIERGSRGVSALLTSILLAVLPTMIEVAVITALLAVMFDFQFVLITLIAFAIFLITTIAFSEWRVRTIRHVNEMDTLTSSMATDSILNYETVKQFGNEEFEAKRYDSMQQQFEAARQRATALLALLNSSQSVIVVIAATFLMWLASKGVVEGKMTLGDLVMLNGFLIQIFLPLGALGVIYNGTREAMTDSEKLFTLLDEKQEVVDGLSALPIGNGKSSIEFDQVNFGYDPTRQILHDISFVIPPGQTIAVVGPSGAGKSTLVRLLLRFFDVGFAGQDGGVIRVNGQDIRGVQRRSLRDNIGVIPQDITLFNNTIRYNIAYGHPSALDSEIEDVAQRTKLLNLIEDLPNKWSTIVGERGLKLSGGEKQRIAIARILLKNPAIVVLDEATSALDSQIEQEIQSAFRGMLRERTTLIIAHRLSTIRDADQILLMENGRISERGTFRDLVNRQGKFAAMWQLQQNT